MTVYRRIVLLVPLPEVDAGGELVNPPLASPPGAQLWYGRLDGVVRGFVDFVTTGPTPPGAFYACETDGATFTVTVPAPPGFAGRHAFAGWPEIA